MITNINASLAETFPAGMSRICVRGFLASIFLSRYLLKAMAALRANTMHNNTKTSLEPVKRVCGGSYAQKKANHCKRQCEDGMRKQYQ